MKTVRSLPAAAGGLMQPARVMLEIAKAGVSAFATHDGKKAVTNLELTK
jgi:hypothetical protein